MNPVVALFTIESLWLSGGASERLRSYNCFLGLKLVKKRKTSFGIKVLSKQGTHQLFPKYEIRAIEFKHGGFCNLH